MAAADRQAMRVLTDDPLAAGTFVPGAAPEGWQQPILSPAHAALVEGVGKAVFWSRDLTSLHQF